MHSSESQLLDIANIYVHQLSMLPESITHKTIDLHNLHQDILMLWHNTAQEIKQLALADEIKNLTYYALCAYTDEFCYRIEHPDALSWQEHSLQNKWFNVQDAGMEFFNKLTTAQHQNQTIVMCIYLLCLQAGFYGKYDLAPQADSAQQPLALPSDCSSPQHDTNSQTKHVTREQLIASLQQQLSSRTEPPSRAAIGGTLRYKIRTLLTAGCLLYCALSAYSWI